MAKDYSAYTGATINATAGMWGVKKANEANLQLQQNQLAWNKNMWHMQNEYNSPAAQMQRMREAGLNTHLMYGQGNEGNANAPAQGVEPAKMRPITEGAGNTIGDYIKLKMVSSQIDNMNADTAVKLKEADKKAFETTGIGIANARDYQDYQIETKTFNNKIRRDQIETAMTGLQLIGLGLNNEGQKLSNDKDTAELVWKEWNEIINAAQNAADFNGTILENKINDEQLRHMQKWHMKMGTENPMLGTLKAIYDELTSDAGEERRTERKTKRAERNAANKDPRRTGTNVDQFLWLIEQVAKDSTNYK